MVESTTLFQARNRLARHVKRIELPIENHFDFVGVLQSLSGQNPCHEICAHKTGIFQHWCHSEIDHFRGDKRFISLNVNYNIASHGVSSLLYAIRAALVLI